MLKCALVSPATRNALLWATTCMSVRPIPVSLLVVRSMRLIKLLCAGTASCAHLGAVRNCCHTGHGCTCCARLACARPQLHRSVRMVCVLSPLNSMERSATSAALRSEGVLHPAFAWYGCNKRGPEHGRCPVQRLDWPRGKPAPARSRARRATTSSRPPAWPSRATRAAACRATHCPPAPPSSSRKPCWQPAGKQGTTWLSYGSRLSSVSIVSAFSGAESSPFGCGLCRWRVPSTRAYYCSFESRMQVEAVIAMSRRMIERSVGG